MDRFKERSLF